MRPSVSSSNGSYLPFPIIKVHAECHFKIVLVLTLDLLLCHIIVLSIFPQIDLPFYIGGSRLKHSCTYSPNLITRVWVANSIPNAGSHVQLTTCSSVQELGLHGRERFWDLLAKLEVQNSRSTLLKQLCYLHRACTGTVQMGPCREFFSC